MMMVAVSSWAHFLERLWWYMSLRKAHMESAVFFNGTLQTLCGRIYNFTPHVHWNIWRNQSAQYYMFFFSHVLHLFTMIPAEKPDWMKSVCVFQAKQSLATLTKDVPKRHSLAMPTETVVNGNQEWAMHAELPLTAAIRQSQQNLYYSMDRGTCQHTPLL